MLRTRVDHNYVLGLARNTNQLSHSYLDAAGERKEEEREHDVVRSVLCMLGRYRLAGTWMPLPLPPTSRVIFILSIQNLMNMTDHAKIHFFVTTKIYR
jgi:hypothetical protein